MSLLWLLPLIILPGTIWGLVMLWYINRKAKGKNRDDE